MTYRIRNIAIALALGLVAALLTTFYVTNYQRNVRKDETNAPVFVAKRDIPAGTAGSDVARKGMLVKTDLVRRSVVPGAISDPDQVLDLVSTQTIYAGEQVTTRRFATPAERGIRAQLKGTMRAFQLPGDQHQLLAGTLNGGDRVDVVASIQVSESANDAITRVVLRDIEVLETSGGPNTQQKLAQASGLWVLLAVTDTQIQKLFHVIRHGEWSLQLRPPLRANDSAEQVQTSRSVVTEGLRGAQLEKLQSIGGNQ
jgi:Flp pilus assembly protein CpaB